MILVMVSVATVFIIFVAILSVCYKHSKHRKRSSRSSSCSSSSSSSSCSSSCSSCSSSLSSEYTAPLYIRSVEKYVSSDRNDVVFTKTTSIIPVWTYWNGNRSHLVDICLAKITESCAATDTYEHYHITEANVLDYIDLDDYSCYHESTVMRSDVLRLALLKEHGGIWVDASMYIIAPVSSLFEPPKGASFFRGYFNPLNSPDPVHPVIEVAAMYCSPGHPLVVKWLSKIRDMVSCSVADRKAAVKRMNVSKHITRVDPAYHFVYFCLQKLLRDEQKGIHSFDDVVLLNTTSTKWFVCDNWEVEDFITLTKEEFSKRLDLRIVKMIKFTRDTRKSVDQKLRQDHRFLADDH